MARYQDYGVTVSHEQAKKIIKAYKNGTGCTIRLSKSDLTGNFKLPLTQRQINRIKRATSGIDLDLSQTQLKHMEKTGGFIPLLALIPAIAAGVAAAGGLAGGVANAVNSSKQARAAEAAQEEQARHNRAIEQQLKSGSGIISDASEHIPIVGKPLSIILKKIGLGGCGCKNLMGFKVGNGLYLEPYHGSGLFLGLPRGK